MGTRTVVPSLDTAEVPEPEPDGLVPAAVDTATDDSAFEEATEDPAVVCSAAEGESTTVDPPEVVVDSAAEVWGADVC